MENSDLSIPWKSRILVLGPSGSGKTSTLIKLLLHQPSIFPSDVKEIIWTNYMGIKESERSQFDELLKQDKFKLMTSDNVESLLNGDSDQINNRILILDDIFSALQNKDATETLELMMKRIANHSNLITFTVSQSTFSNKFPSDLREQANWILNVGTVPEYPKFKAFLLRTIVKKQTVLQANKYINALTHIVDHSPEILKTTHTAQFLKKLKVDEFFFWEYDCDRSVFYKVEESSNKDQLIAPNSAL